MRNVVSCVKRIAPCAALALLALAAAQPAEARGHHRHHHSHRAFAFHRVRAIAPAMREASGREYFGPYVGATNYAAMVVDANTGRTLFSANADEPRHPASITKVMTLYLLFEELESGRMRLDTPLRVSAHAAAQAPTKLGLRPGSTILVENAIKAIVTKSANDMAVAVAENIAGDEETFAEAMTRKAHELGMTHTFYHNASGLPDMRQITTAHDLTILGRAIHDRFPRYYRYFSTPSFTYAGSFMANHNHLMGRIDGMDGIKTGYTAASGFNLLSSVSRDGRHLIAVVMGGRTASSRDHVMASLIGTHMEEASATPATEVAQASPVEAAAPPPKPIVEEVPADRQPTRAREETADADEGDAPVKRISFTASEPARPRPVERQPPRGPNLIAPDLALPAPVFATRAADVPRPPVRIAMADPVPSRPGPAPLAAAKSTARAERDPAPKAPHEKVRPAFIAGAPHAFDAARLPAPLGAADRRRLALDGSTAHRVLLPAAAQNAVATATPSSLRWVTGAQPVRLGPSADSRAAAGDRADPAPTSSITPRAETRVARAEVREPAARASASRGGWVIQIGATDNVEKADALLARARTQVRGALAAATPLTQKIQKGDALLYRARFAGLEPDAANAACRALKRSGFACFAMRD